MIGALPKPVPIKTYFSHSVAQNIPPHMSRCYFVYSDHRSCRVDCTRLKEREAHKSPAFDEWKSHLCSLNWWRTSNSRKVKQPTANLTWLGKHTLKAPTFHKPWSNPDIRVIPHHQKHRYQAAVSSHYANHSSPREAAAEESIYIHIKRAESGAMAWAQDFNRILMVFRAGPFYRFKVQ